MDFSSCNFSVFTLIPSINAEEPTTESEKLSTSKKAIKTDKLGIYDIEISVPGVIAKKNMMKLNK